VRLLFENWRKFITEQDDPNATVRFDPEPGPPMEAPWGASSVAELNKWLKENENITLLRYLGKGAYGKVYEVAMPDGRRSAMKIVNKRMGGAQADREAANYEWIQENKDSLPEEVAEYLPDIYHIINDVPLEGDYHLLIFMEYMEPAPTEVTHQFLATGGRGQVYATKQKEARLLKDANAVSSMVKDVMSRAQPYLSQIDSNIDTSSLATRVTGPFLRGLNVSYPEEMKRIDYMAYESDDISDERRRLLNSIARVLHDTFKDYEGYDSWYVGMGMQEMAEYLNILIARQVMPIRHREPSQSVLGGGSEEVQEVFPEMEGLTAAMEYLYGQNFEPSDIHGGNIMMRPTTGHLVITDVGHFTSHRKAEREAQETMDV